MVACQLHRCTLGVLSRPSPKAWHPTKPAKQDSAKTQKVSCHRNSWICRVSKQDAEKEPGDPSESGDYSWGITIGSVGVLCGLIGYAAFISPNQVPFQDQYFIQKIVGIIGDDGYQVNRVFRDLFILMGVPPAIYAALLIPAGRSKNKVPAWPFITASFAFGCFVLIPYFALWQPDETVEAPPKPESMEGWTRPFLQFQETSLYGILLGVSALYLLGDGVLAGDSAWKEYSDLFETSRLVHVTSLDFLTLNLLIPFWLSNDASKRSWDQADGIGKVLPFIPLVGPAIYLALRPTASSLEE